MKLFRNKKIALLLTLSVLFSACASIPQKLPNISLKKMEESRQEKDILAYKMSLNVENTNSVNYKLRLNECEVLINNIPIGNIQPTNFIKMPANKSKILEFDFEMQPTGIKKALLTAFFSGKNNIPISIKGTASVRILYFFRKTILINKTVLLDTQKILKNYKNPSNIKQILQSAFK